MSTTIEGLPGLIEDYLKLRRCLGYKLEGTETLLLAFVSYLRDHDAQSLTVEHAVGFATQPLGSSPRWHALRLSAIRCFARWARCQDPDIEVPPARILPARPTRTAPFIYTAEQIQALMQTAGALEPALRGATYQTLIGLMASTGIRTGEALALDVASLDERDQTLTVRGKYDKIRLLPLHPTVIEALSGYLEVRERVLPAAACPALLISSWGTRLRASNVHETFQKIRDRAGLVPVSSSCRPRLHDLRHAFTVTTMLDAYRRGEDPAVVLPVLSTWLGHTEPRDTYWYLTGTAELLAAAQRLQTQPGGEETSRS